MLELALILLGAAESFYSAIARRLRRRWPWLPRPGLIGFIAGIATSVIGVWLFLDKEPVCEFTKKDQERLIAAVSDYNKRFPVLIYFVDNSIPAETYARRLGET